MRKSNDLQHHGILGMKWGVRRSLRELIENRLTNKTLKARYKWDSKYREQHIRKIEKLKKKMDNVDLKKVGGARKALNYKHKLEKRMALIKEVDDIFDNKNTRYDQNRRLDLLATRANVSKSYDFDRSRKGQKSFDTRDFSSNSQNRNKGSNDLSRIEKENKFLDLKNSKMISGTSRKLARHVYKKRKGISDEKLDQILNDLQTEQAMGYAMYRRKSERGDIARTLTKATVDVGYKLAGVETGKKTVKALIDATDKRKDLHSVRNNILKSIGEDAAKEAGFNREAINKSLKIDKVLDAMPKTGKEIYDYTKEKVKKKKDRK